MERHVKRALVGFSLGAFVSPPAVLSAYLILSRWPSRWFTTSSDWLFLALSVGVGVACLSRLPLPPAGRIALATCYVPVAVWILLHYALFFLMFVFGVWL